MVKAYADYDSNSCNSFKTYSVEHLQEGASDWFNDILDADKKDGDVDTILESMAVSARKYRNARIRLGLSDARGDYDHG